MKYFILSIIVVALTSCSSNSESNNNQSSMFINGLEPTDVYLNMEKQGFSTMEQLNEDNGNMWISTYMVSGIDYKVETYSSNIRNVESVRATAMIDLSQKNITATEQFFIFISSLPYENSNPQTAGQWIKDNFNNDKATTTIGDAKFTIYAPSKALRILNVEKSK